ncbi:hypothetical protein AX774_g6098 [Zancudomyces culisetae]|uniref:Uncharacterized protein n=1 Tax=Zancudomyces culisetae TaxID=1213189 RepID=A0A1R1PHR4_ZANCU|nr:hypothetical protein AX774_g6098 [Zancudomyces culisetae]|eukprot:OMH80469.1 hypothetical protein AX774_g6098 [Zancudomyces culisetae]
MRSVPSALNASLLTPALSWVFVKSELTILLKCKHEINLRSNQRYAELTLDQSNFAAIASVRFVAPENQSGVCQEFLSSFSTH